MTLFARYIQPMISHRKGRFAKRPPTLLLVLAILLTSLSSFLISPVAAQSTPVTLILTIERLQDLERQDDCSAEVDYYAEVQLNGGSKITSSIADDDADLNPPPADWVDLFQTTIAVDPSVPTSIPIAIDVQDEDPFFFCLGNSVDDIADISPIAGRTQLRLDVNLGGGLCSITGDVSGLCGPSLTAQGNGDDDYDTIITFHVDVINSVATADGDGDGIPDEWEQNGVTINGEFIDLPGKLDAAPDHKDIFIELDTMAGQAISRDDIKMVKDAFSVAPSNAGSQASALPNGVDAPPNPDNFLGINIHIDTGASVMGSEDGFPPSCRDGIDNGTDNLTDTMDLDCTSTGIEDGAPADTCNDGRDNNLDGFKDGNDPDCHPGDDLGGGGLIATQPTCGLNQQFYDIKKANFNPNRRRIFHYAVSAVRLPGPCDSDNDGKIDDFNNDGIPDPPFGGLGELGGNDFIDYNHNGATLMHELGHNLNLGHGGDQEHNCKPNYVSIMNYDYPFGIQQRTGAIILDYSPPRITPDGLSRSTAPLSLLEEDELNETLLRLLHHPASHDHRSEGAGAARPGGELGWRLHDGQHGSGGQHRHVRHQHPTRHPDLCRPGGLRERRHR
jgi:hypothetical protein